MSGLDTIRAEARRIYTQSGRPARFLLLGCAEYSDLLADEHLLNVARYSSVTERPIDTIERYLGLVIVIHPQDPRAFCVLGDADFEAYREELRQTMPANVRDSERKP